MYEASLNSQRKSIALIYMLGVTQYLAEVIKETSYRTVDNSVDLGVTVNATGAITNIA